MVSKNPFLLAHSGFSALLGITALIVQSVGLSKARLSYGPDNEFDVFSGPTYDPTRLLKFNIFAAVFLVLAILCLIATLLFHASRWRPAKI